MPKSDPHSAQEAFWAGDFGNDYIARNMSPALLASNIKFFSKGLDAALPPKSCIEFGANIGMNLKAIRHLYPDCTLRGVEINEKAAALLGNEIGVSNVFCGSILDYACAEASELALIKGVLIHINPEQLPLVYDKLYGATSRYLLVCEYYNPSPVSIPYRGHHDRLFKRDFAGEIMDRFSDLRLVDYGFAYHRDPAFPQDDISWFLMKKGA
ncbi:pseudaminic acid biosynthesis-associated methylase [Bradyrhizobium sp. CB2312]|uniref:pseudaminic acid biosynthesis-associated methylase n=1 Tax=Bradyrhizobium sp. CB2312 TaxID=3039155 RepID=UPI0024B25F9F|nr:pseudaminic acid biosynthesis-associated methylase [Bradyrhizobium sp. CB2312]WFU75676.1 pseudaminic acid biosynthesis-associated methylase [Bradyrhizobium sp. CB2312]